MLQWPPLLKSGPVTVGKGVDASLVGTLRRPGGSTQLSYGGHPLYTYNLDITPGMVTGQAIDQDGGLWYVLNAKGSADHDVVLGDDARRQRLSRRPAARSPAIGKRSRPGPGPFRLELDEDA